MTNVGSVNCCFYFTFFRLEIILNLYMASIFCFPCLFFESFTGIIWYRMRLFWRRIPDAAFCENVGCPNDKVVPGQVI